MIEILPQKFPQIGTLILLHGWGANGHDLAPLGESLNFKNAHLLFPEGQGTVPGGWGAGKSWFTFPVNENSQRDRLKSREQIFLCISELIQKGIDPKTIILLGFSQGACMAVDVALSYRETVGGIVVLSGFYIDDDGKNENINYPNGIPIFSGHGLYDPIVPLTTRNDSLKILEDRGFSITWKDYPIAHNIAQEEIRDVRNFLNRIWEVSES